MKIASCVPSVVLLSKTFLFANVSLCLMWCDHLGGQEAKQEKKYRDRSLTIVLESAGQGDAGIKLQSTTMIEPLEAGQDYRLKLRVKNSTNEAISFDRIETSCRCGSLKLDKEEIGAKQIIGGEITWDVPSSIERNRVGIRATLFDKDNAPVAEIRLQSFLKGNLFVGRVSEGRRDGQGMFEWKVPIEVSAPLTLQDLEIDLSEKLEGYAVSLITNGKDRASTNTEQVQTDRKNKTRIPQMETGVVQILAPESVVGNEFRFGELIVKDPQSRKRFKRNLALYTRPPVRVSPVSLMFRPTQDDDASALAQALAQLDKQFFMSRLDSEENHQDRQGDTAEFALSFHAELVIDKTPVEVKVIHLGATVYRLKVLAKRSLFEDGDKLQGRWTVKINGEQFEIPVTASMR